MLNVSFGAVPVFSACVPKTKFEDRKRVPAFTKQGVPLWAVRVMAPQLRYGALVDEMVTVSIAATEDPAQGIPRGAAVDFDGLMHGRTPHRVVDGKVAGGVDYFIADGVRVRKAA
ncbi:hypothetical protein ACTI_37730 [Actinoplanes sp. OR16]|uniref:hypothetical protein n=1 Tax=Actinoplanes sp. OR16 TaxID=946334 RepID=UPI000F6DB042|nr:hypothetical protein [Actinoplanes sp. OR16]BBH67088.1 hypothetical protein ACTI_37730 [Actinoplanes sp. OR16]